MATLQNPELADIRQFSKLVAKMYLDRRPFRGATEFGFRIRPPKGSAYQVEVRARRSAFRATVKLRRRSSDVPTFEQVFVNNDYNFRRLKRWQEIKQLYSSLLKNGTPLILDLGANVGLSSLYFAKNWPEARIVAVEPSDGNIDAMSENVARFPNITPIRAGVASRDGAIRITNPSGRTCEFRTELAKAGSDGATIPAVSVASLIALVPDAAYPRPFIAKIDIEGAEDELFSSNTEWVELFPIIVLEPHDWLFPQRAAVKNFLGTISRYERDFVISGGNVYSIANRFTL